MQVYRARTIVRRGEVDLCNSHPLLPAMPMPIQGWKNLGARIQERWTPLPERSDTVNPGWHASVHMKGQSSISDAFWPLFDSKKRHHISDLSPCIRDLHLWRVSRRTDNSVHLHLRELLWCPPTTQIRNPWIWYEQWYVGSYEAMVTTPAVEGCSGSRRANEIRLGNRARRQGRKIKTHDLLQTVRSMHRGGNSVLWQWYRRADNISCANGRCEGRQAWLTLQQCMKEITKWIFTFGPVKCGRGSSLVARIARVEWETLESVRPDAFDLECNARVWCGSGSKYFDGFHIDIQFVTRKYRTGRKFIVHCPRTYMSADDMVCSGH